MIQPDCLERRTGVNNHLFALLRKEGIRIKGWFLAVPALEVSDIGDCDQVVGCFTSDLSGEFFCFPASQLFCSS